jgi:cytochrome b561
MYEEQYDWPSVTIHWLLVLMTQLMPCVNFTHGELHLSTAHFHRQKLQTLTL